MRQLVTHGEGCASEVRTAAAKAALADIRSPEGEDHVATVLADFAKTYGAKFPSQLWTVAVLCGWRDQGT